jgi:xanthine dehydrogenase large subunit
VNDRAMFHADNAYFYPAVHIRSRRVRTNTVSNTAFRGFGGPQGMMFAERAMDAIAHTLRLDPLDVRKRNLYGPGRNVTPYGMTVDDNIAPELIEELERSSDYRSRRQAVSAFNAENAFSRRAWR